MIVYVKDDERIIPAQLNVLGLEMPGGGYIYVDANTYAQAAVLDNKYWNKTEELDAMIVGNAHADAVASLRNILPKPINILAPFLKTIEPTFTFERKKAQLIGALHVLSTSINFLRYLTLTTEVRKSVSFSEHIKYEYEMAWAQFLNESVPYQAVYDVFAKDGVFANATVPAITTSAVGMPAVTTNKGDTPMAVSAPAGSSAEIQKLAQNPEIIDLMLNASMPSLDEIMKEAEEEKKAPPKPAATEKTTTTNEAASGKNLLDDWDD